MKVKLSKRDDFGRRWRSFWRHTWLCAQPFIIAIAAVIFWRWLRSKGYYFCKEDEVPLAGGAGATLVLTYGITVVLLFNYVWGKHSKMMSCVLPHQPQDQRTFLLCRDERAPVIIYLFLFFLSALLLGMIMLFNYHKELSGIAAVFSVSFAMTLYSVVVAQLEDPAKSPWLLERVPKKWFKIDIDEFFKMEKLQQEERKE